jgi:hypothetical protein
MILKQKVGKVFQLLTVQEVQFMVMEKELVEWFYQRVNKWW